MVMVVVFNSSPWIFLSKLGIIEPALSLFKQVFIPSSVIEEILSKRNKAARALGQLQKEMHITVLEAKNFRLLNALGNRLGRGEAEAITVAIEREADIVALDDHVARSEAMRLGLQVKGTLGIIRRLMELNMFEGDIRELSENLKRMNFRVRDKVFWEIFRDIKQKPKS
jgi:predicted nucleic acid-binding protein